jgi:hypothetical protein
MTSGLTAAYLALHLDPNNDKQTAAFETLCWTHIFHHTSPHWVEQAQIHAFPLVREIETASDPKKKTHAYDHTLNRLTFEFVQNYARVIWPSAEANRSHLTVQAGTQSKLKGTPAYMRAHTTTQAKVARELGRPCAEQLIVAESTIGRRVREFFKELIVARTVPSLGEYGAEQLLYMVLGWVEMPASLVIPRHPRITAERFRCPGVGCGRIYAWSEALAAHFRLAHVGVDSSESDTTVDSPTISPSLSPPDDKGGSNPAPTSALVPSQWSDTQTGFTLPNSWADTQTGSTLPDARIDIQMESVLPDARTDTQTESVLPDTRTDTQMESVLPDQSTDIQTGTMLPVPSNIAAPHEAGPFDNSNHYCADVMSLGSSDDEEDSEDDQSDISGLPCPYPGCQLRFADWASFDEHAQLPHNDSVSNGGEMFTANAVTDADDLHEAMDTSEVGRDGNEVLSTRVQQELFLGGPVSGNGFGWRNMAGERT